MDDKPGSRFFDTSYVIYQQFVHDKLWTSADDFRRVKGGHTDEQKKHKLGIKLKPTKVKTKTTKETKKRLSNTIKDPDRNSVLLVDIENIRKSGDCEKLLISENVISSFLPNNDVVEVIETVDNVGSSVETSVATLVETSVATLVETSVEKILQPSVETKVTIVEEIKENIEEILPETSNRNDITVSAIIHRPNSIGKDSQLSDDLTTNNNINNNLEIVHQIDEIIELRETNVPELNELKLELNEDSTSNRSTITEEIITTLLINENELNLNENPKVNLSRSTSISDKSVTGTELSVNIKRKQYERRSTDTTDDCDDSSFDESDDPVYEQVKIGNGKNYDGNQTIPKSQSFPISSHQQKVTETLRLHYVTERILSSVLPPRSQQNDEQQSFIDDNNIVVYEDKYERELINMLEQKHGKNYRLFDLESCISTITLEKLCELCKHIDSWLGSGREKVVVLQDRGDRQRLGAAIAAYLEYQKICGSNFPRQKPHINEDQRAQSAISRNWLDLDIFSMQKFLEDVAGPLRVPSHKRYLTYFSGLLSGNIKMNSSPLHLKFVSLESPPSWLHYDSLSSQSAEWKSFIKIYEGLNCVFTSDIHVIPISTRQFIYEVGHLRLRGDVTIRCYQIVPYDGHHKTYQGERELMFSAQFHTCAVTEKEISFKRNDLDFACDDPRFPLDHKVTMNFGNSKSEVNKLVIQSPLIRIEPATSLARWDSLENLKEGSSHTQGPLDGSLYATITKNSKSPQSSPTSSDIQNLNDNNNILVTTTTTTTSTPIKPIRISSNTSSSTSYNVISPPPEFRNTKLGGTGEGGGVGGSSDQIVDNRYTRSISVPVHTNNNSVNNNNINNNNINNNNNNNINNYQVREIITKNSTSSYQSPPPTYEEILIQPISKLTSKEPIYSSKLQTQNSLTGTTSNNQYSSNTLQKFQDSGRYTNPTTATTPINNNNNNNNSYQNNQIRIVETTTTTTSAGGVEGTGTNRYNNNNNNNNNAIENGVGNYQGDGRESVRSPLTLSMDSGISSSGVNRRTQGSSVSPSSFPSQASPQEDRHRELDDILSDMLMTVQDIPDYGNNNNNNIINNNHINTINKSQSLTKIQNKNNLPTSSVSSLASSQFDTNTIKRSQSYTLREESILLNSSNNNNNNKDRDIYDTSSTTTTLTPPPSESGRETPTPSQIDDQHIYNEKRRDNEVEEIINMDLQQNQSYIYPQTGRTEITLVSEDEDNIPYHAREYSRPFTYGNVPQSPQYPPSGVMLKMQSGLSSPSLVRKQLGNNTITTTTTTTTSQHNNINKKTPPRNDFEEMFRERREKVLNEKYSISDKTNGLNLNNNNNNNNNISGIYDYKKSSPSPSAYTTTNNSENNKWFNTTQTSKTTSSTNNGYGYHEPLKRSNTMDGGFGRSTSTDGISGQTWLQLQQQKLRAKKELQLKEDRDQYDRIIRTEIHTLQNNRPVRSRSSASNRYDGYVSDTAAFNNDEIDYRRPLHVQTPHTPNRASERNYHTLTTTTVTSNERPFVAVKRGHEQAIHGINSSSPTSPLSVLNASPNGQIAHAQNQQNGLLSFVDGNSPRNGHGRLESDSISSSSNDEASSNYNNNNHNNKNNNMNMDRISNNNNINHYDEIRTNGNETNGQLTLNKLLASLAINNNQNNNINCLDEQINGTNKTIIIHNENNLYHNNNNNNNNNNNKIQTIDTRRGELIIDNTDNTNLSDVIANLTEFDNNETIRRETVNMNNNLNNHHNNRSFIDQTTILLMNNNNNNNNCPTIKRLTTHSDNSSSISPSPSERSNGVSWSDQVREESFSSYRSETEPETSPIGGSRPETPAFPVTPRTPYGIGNSSPALPPKSPTSQRRNFNSTWSLRSQKSALSSYDLSKDLYAGNQTIQHHNIINHNQIQNQNDSCYTSRRNSTTSNTNSEPQDVAPQHVKFVRDSSKFWYRPTISRDEAVSLLRNAHPGTFIVRDSTTFANAYGLVIKVAHPPPGVAPKGPPGDELVRHFLVEPTTRGVRLKGCANEPVFTSLSALVYQHSITPLALPCKLIIPERQEMEYNVSQTQEQFYDQGAACNVLYLYSCETESLTGPQAVRKAVSLLFARRPLPTPTQVHFKVSRQGVTLTDNTRQLFFRKHYSANHITFCGLDPDGHMWSVPTGGETPVANFTIFAFVAKRSPSTGDNQCHVFCQLEPNQPAAAIVSYAHRVIPNSAQPVATKSI